MILTLDIGNTNIALGGFFGGELVFSAKMASNPTLTGDEYACKLLDILSLYGVNPNRVEGAILSSVVPALNQSMASAVQAAGLGVWLHGRAGDLAAGELTEYAVTPEEVLSRLPAAIGELI